MRTVLEPRAVRGRIAPLARFLARPRPLRTQLLALALSIALPFTAYSAYLLWRFAEQNRTHYEQQLRNHVENLAQDIDRQLEGMVSTLQTLATSSALQRGAYADFQARALQALAGRELTILLYEPSGRQLVNTRVPYGTPLPITADNETLRRTIATQRPQVSNLFIGKVARRPVLDVHVPVLYDGALRYVLAMSFFPDLIRDISLGQANPPSLVTGVSDANGMVIARSHLHEKFVNTRLPDELFKRRLEPGIFEAVNLDGVPVLRAVTRLKSADWMIAATVYRSTVSAAARQGLAELILVGSALIALAAFAAALLARAASRNMESLAAAGDKLGHGESVPVVEGPIAEANAVAQSLAIAGLRRQAHEAKLLLEVVERKQAEEALRRHGERQEMLLDITSAFITAADRQALGEIAFERIAPSFGADVCFNYRLDEAGGGLDLVFERGIPPANLADARHLDLDQAFCGTAAASCRPVVADRSRIETDPKGAFVRDLGLTAYACHPLRSADGDVLGTFSLGSTTRPGFTPEEVVFLETVANCLAQAWERLDGEEEVREGEERLRAASAAARFGVHDLRVATGKTRWSAELVRMLGLGDTGREVTFEEAGASLHPEDHERVTAEFRAITRRVGPYEIECRTVRPDGETRWLLDRGEAIGPIDQATGLVQRVTGTVIDITGRKRAEEELQRSYETYLSLIQNAPLGVYLVDAQFRLAEVSTGAQKVFSNVSPLIGRDFAEVLRIIWQEPFASEAIARFRHTLATGEPYRSRATTEHRADIEDTESYDWQIERVILPDGRFGVVCYFYDLTEHKRYESRIEFLLREVNHRAKNMLALAQAIARQTATTRPEEFLERFSDRLQALAANQDLLVANDWQGVGIEELTRVQLAHFADLVGQRIRLAGPALRLNAGAAQGIGMAIHELATNAGKYGALSSDEGSVDLAWQLAGGTLTITWTERDGPPVATPLHRGFGNKVIETMAAMSVGGEVHLDYPSSGVVWRLECPAGNALETHAFDKGIELPFVRKGAGQ